MQFDLVVFDWDGTLMDSTSAITRCLRAACADIGLADPGPRAASHVIGLGLDEALRQVAPGITDQQVSQLVERYRHHYLTSDHELILFPDAYTTVAELKAKGVFLAVATGKSRFGLNRAFEQTGLGALFAASRCADECHSKPHPQMLEELMEQFNVVPDRTVMIGDTTHDLLMAQAAGVASVALTTGAHPFEALQEANPSVLFNSLTNMQPWLHQRIAKVGTI